jgi:hypothetical protein
MKSEREKEGRKKPYEKPRLTTIELAVEEVLGVGCKLDLSGWACGATPCTYDLGVCNQAGS